MNGASESDIVERPYFASFYSLIAQARLPHNPYLLLLSLARRDFPVLSLRFRRRISCIAFFLERTWLRRSSFEPYSTIQRLACSCCLTAQASRRKRGQTSTASSVAVEILLVLGGRAFTRSAFRDVAGWKLRDYSVRFTRPLMIDQYQVTPGSDGLECQTNPDMTVQLSPFSWKRGFSPVIHLSAVDLYNRQGSAGSIDARLDALAWGIKDGRKLAAPIIQIDHFRNEFNGGRWIFMNAELMADFYTSPQTIVLIRALAEEAIQGSQEFMVRPVLPLYLPGEPVELDVVLHAGEQSLKPLTLKIATFPDANPSNRLITTVALPTRPSTCSARAQWQRTLDYRSAVVRGREASRCLSLGFLDQGSRLPAFRSAPCR